LRTIIIGLISLAAVLAIYLLYSQVSKTPKISIEKVAQSTDTQADSNVGDFDSEIGKIADVGIAALTKPVFQHLKNGQVDREFGFEELLHQVKDEWEVEKPYINIYQPNFNCYVTADRGTVQVETAALRPSVGDATFVGNVVIRILPASGSDVNESFIYLEDVAFVSEKSLLSTAGPVRFVSQNAQMLGDGLELIYNDQLQRLEYFRIIHLESLRFPAQRWAGFSRTTGNRESNPEPRTPNPEQQEGQYYKCMLNKNVVIDAPFQLVFAQDSVSINNIFWPRASAEKSYPEHTGNWRSEIGNYQLPITSYQPGVDIIVSCDNGVVFVPMDSACEQTGNWKSEIGNYQLPITSYQTGDDIAGRPTFVTCRIDYDVSTGDAVALGPSKLVIGDWKLVNTSYQLPVTSYQLPVEITAQKETKFSSVSNQVIFEGDCVCTMLRTDPNDVQQKYTLSAPKLIANLTPACAGASLPLQKQGQDPNNKSRIEHLTADEGQVLLKSIRTVKGQLISGVELDCFKTEYDVGQQLFVATGPGTIRLNNSSSVGEPRLEDSGLQKKSSNGASVAEPNEQAGRFSLRQPCYAFLRDFATLTYFQKANRIVADAEPGGTLRMDYFPIIAGKSDQQVVATAAHAELDLVQAANGQTELSSLTASGGITYEYQNNEFLGGKLFYDPGKFIMKVLADESGPCYYNGALVDGIEVDLKTGNVKAQILTPGALQIP